MLLQDLGRDPAQGQPERSPRGIGDQFVQPRRERPLGNRDAHSLEPLLSVAYTGGGVAIPTVIGFAEHLLVDKRTNERLEVLSEEGDPEVVFLVDVNHLGLTRWSTLPVVEHHHVMAR